MLSRDRLSFLLRWCLDSWNCSKTCSSYLIHPPQDSFSSLLSATLTPLTSALLLPSGLRSTHELQVYLDLHALYNYHHARPLCCDFEKLVKSFLHQPWKERQHAEILMQVQNHPRGRIFWPLIERAESSEVCILLGGDRT